MTKAKDGTKNPARKDSKKPAPPDSPDTGAAGGGTTTEDKPTDAVSVADVIGELLDDICDRRFDDEHIVVARQRAVSRIIDLLSGGAVPQVEPPEQCPVCREAETNKANGVVIVQIPTKLVAGAGYGRRGGERFHINCILSKQQSSALQQVFDRLNLDHDRLDDGRHIEHRYQAIQFMLEAVAVELGLIKAQP